MAQENWMPTFFLIIVKRAKTRTLQMSQSMVQIDVLKVVIKPSMWLPKSKKRSFGRRRHCASTKERRLSSSDSSSNNNEGVDTVQPQRVVLIDLNVYLQYGQNKKLFIINHLCKKGLVETLPISMPW